MSAAAGPPPLPPGATLASDRSHGLVTLVIIMIILPGLAIIVRLWSRALAPRDRATRVSNGRRFWWDDLFVVLAWVVMTVMNGLGLRLIALGLGRPIAAVDPSMDQISEFLRLLFANELLYHLGLTLAKSSAVLFFYRIFDVGGSWYYWSLRVTHGLVWLWLPASWLTTIFSCSPVEKYWQPWLPGTCLNQESIWLGIAIPNLLLDLMILLLPLPKLWKLKIKPAQKLLLTGVFVLGYGEIIVTIGENVTLIQAGPTLGDDLTWNSVNYIYWLITSIPILIVTVCLPPSVSLFRRAKKHGLASLLRTEVRSYQIPLRDTEYGSKRTDATRSNGESESGTTVSRAGSDSKGLVGSTYTVAVDGGNEEAANVSHNGIQVRHDYSISR